MTEPKGPEDRPVDDSDPYESAWRRFAEGSVTGDRGADRTWTFVPGTYALSRLERVRAAIDSHFPELYAAAAILGLFALSDPSDRIGFATGAVATTLAALVVWRAER